MASDASSASAATLAEFITKVRADNGKPITPITARTYAACIVRIRGLIGGDPMFYQWPIQDKPTLEKTLLSITFSSRKTCLCALLAWSKTVMSKPADVVEYIQTLVDEIVEQSGQATTSSSLRRSRPTTGHPSPPQGRAQGL